MASKTLRLLFYPARTRPLPAPASAHIYVAMSCSDESGLCLISSECRTPEEVRYYVDQLKKELDAIARQAERKFGKDQHKREG